MSATETKSLAEHITDQQFARLEWEESCSHVRQVMLDLANEALEAAAQRLEKQIVDNESAPGQQDYERTNACLRLLVADICALKSKDEPA